MTAFGGYPVPEEILTLQHGQDPSAPENLRYAPAQDTVNGVPQPEEITTGFADGENARELETLASDGSDPDRELVTLFTDGEDPLQAYHPQLRVVPAALQREARESTAVPGERENHTVRNIVVATLAAALAVRALDAVWTEEAKGWEGKGRFDGTGFDRRIGTTFIERLTGPLAALLPGLLLMGRSNVGDSLGVAYSQKQAAPVAAGWSRAYAGKVAGDYARTSAEALGAQVAVWVNAGMPAAQMARRARDVYGLDPRAAHAIAQVTNPQAKGNRQRIPLIEGYLEHRATTNARVWAMAAQNAGREMLFTELVEAGLLPKDTRKVWLTAHDERTCPVCKPMDSVGVPLNARFSVGGSHLQTPPVHPNCRCTISVDTEPQEGLVYAKDYSLLKDWLRAATRTVFR